MQHNEFLHFSCQLISITSVISAYLAYSVSVSPTYYQLNINLAEYLWTASTKSEHKIKLQCRMGLANHTIITFNFNVIMGQFLMIIALKKYITESTYS